MAIEMHLLSLPNINYYAWILLIIIVTKLFSRIQAVF